MRDIVHYHELNYMKDAVDLVGNLSLIQCKNLVLSSDANFGLVKLLFDERIMPLILDIERSAPGERVFNFNSFVKRPNTSPACSQHNYACPCVFFTGPMSVGVMVHVKNHAKETTNLDKNSIEPSSKPTLKTSTKSTSKPAPAAIKLQVDWVLENTLVKDIVHEHELLLMRDLVRDLGFASLRQYADLTRENMSCDMKMLLYARVLPLISDIEKAKPYQINFFKFTSFVMLPDPPSTIILNDNICPCVFYTNPTTVNIAINMKSTESTSKPAPTTSTESTTKPAPTTSTESPTKSAPTTSTESPTKPAPTTSTKSPTKPALTANPLVFESFFLQEEKRILNAVRVAFAKSRCVEIIDNNCVVDCFGLGLENRHTPFLLDEFTKLAETNDKLKVILILDNNRFSQAVFRCDKFADLLKHKNMIRIIIRSNLFHHDEILDSALMRDTCTKVIFIQSKYLPPFGPWVARDVVLSSLEAHHNFYLHF